MVEPRAYPQPRGLCEWVGRIRVKPYGVLLRKELATPSVGPVMCWVQRAFQKESKKGSDCAAVSRPLQRPLVTKGEILKSPQIC